MKQLFQRKGPLLALRERIFLLICFAILSLLSVTSWQLAGRSRLYLKQTAQTAGIVIQVEGAVAKPGKYLYKEPITVKKILEDVGVYKEADLSFLPVKGKITESIALYIPYQEKISIHVKGAVPEPKTYRVGIRTTLQELEHMITLTKESDRRLFKKKRVVKDGEILEIPRKKIKNKKSS